MPAPRRTLGGGRRLVPDHRAEPPVGRELRDEQLRRPDVTACPLEEEAVPPERRLDHSLHDAGVLGRHRGVVRAEDDRMAGVVDDRRNREVVVAVEADDGQRVVDGAVPVETDCGPAVGGRHPPVHGERRRPATGTDAHRAHRGSSFHRGLCHRVEHRLDVGSDELPVLPDPGSTELERDRNRVVVRRSDRDVVERHVGGRRNGSPGARRLLVVEDAEVDIGDGGARAIRAFDDENRRPELEVVRLRYLVRLVSPPAGRDPHRRGDVDPADARTHGHPRAAPFGTCSAITVAALRNSAAQRTSSGGRRPRATPHCGSARGGGRRRPAPSRSCPDGPPRRPAGRGR